MKTFLKRVLLGALLTGGALAARAVSGPVEDARAVVSDWPAESRGTAEALIDRLGVPDKIGADELVWNGRAAVYRDPGEIQRPSKAAKEAVTQPVQAPGEPQPKGY